VPYSASNRLANSYVTASPSPLSLSVALAIPLFNSPGHWRKVPTLNRRRRSSALVRLHVVGLRTGDTATRRGSGAITTSGAWLTPDLTGPVNLVEEM
jgi:hypothetical protein